MGKVTAMTVDFPRCKTCKHFSGVEAPEKYGSCDKIPVGWEHEDAIRKIYWQRLVDNHLTWASNERNMPAEHRQKRAEKRRQIEREAKEFYERTHPRPLAVVQDGSDYSAVLEPTEDFGCVLHEPKE